MKYKPVFEDVASQPPGDVFMATVNADESSRTMAYYGIDSIPATLFFVSGEEVYRTQGILQKQELLDTIVKYIPSAAPETPPSQAAPSPSDQVSPAPVKPGPVGPRPAQQAPASAPTTPAVPKAAQAANSPGLSKTTLIVGVAAILAVTATVILLSSD
jgi:hypothetical protein